MSMILQQGNSLYCLCVLSFFDCKSNIRNLQLERSRVKKLNKELEILNSQIKEEQNYKMSNWHGNTIGEA